ncbi:biotin-dependent carboxyltransferase family protein [Candidatus Thioglobus sp.]|nr:biotin-dependent carboxyltransferase family protein [Candidatus Thioglobus sp.]
MSFKVIKPGFLTTVQDYGRLNHSQQGLAQSGVMDEHAYAWANYLLGNHYFDAALEITFGSVELQALDNMLICVCGADLDFKINHKAVDIWKSIQIQQGDRLSWHLPKHGIRAYLAVQGGFETQKLFNSRSVNLREHIGSKITQDEVLVCQASIDLLDRFIAPKYIPNYHQEVVLRLLPSYQYSEFSDDQKTLFFSQTYTISHANDRTGCRLKGAPIAIKKDKMISEGMSYGSIEIASDGLPIILLKDAPTIGGYLKIGSVFSLDLALLAQQQPGAKVRFELMNIHQAQKKRLAFNQFFGVGENSKSLKI